MTSIQEEMNLVARFAENNDSEAANRLKKRLGQDRKPSTRSSTEQWINWGNMADILGQPFDVSRIPLSKLEQMQRDPMLSFGMMFVKVPLIRAPWYIKSSDARRAAFVDNALRKIYGRLILAYTNAFSFGFSGMVKRFEYENPDWTYVNKDDADATESPVWSDKSVDALIWKPFLALNPRNITPHWGAKGNFAGIDFTNAQGISAFGNSAFSPGFGGDNNKKVADIPLDWALWATNEKDTVYGSLWGYPRLGYAYRYWWSYWYLFGLSDRAYERWADPPIIVYHPTNTGLDTDGNEVDYSEEGLILAEKARSGANISMPGTTITSGIDERAIQLREWEISQLKAEINFQALDDMFKYLDTLKLRSMMVPEQSLTEGQGGSSSRNVAEKFGDIFQASQAVVMQEIDDMINRFMIPQILEANFGPGGPSCEKVTTGFDPQDVDTMRSVVQAFANKEGIMPVDIRETLERLGVPTLSHAAFQEELKKKAEEAEKLLPPTTESNSSSGTVGVNKQGLYYDSKERIVLSDTEKGVLRKTFDKILGTKEEKEN